MQNYKLLPSLLSILRTRNLTDSAKELNVTQSAMSKTFRQIREAFDDQIMVREGNQYILTRKGQELHRQLPELMGKLDLLFKSEDVDPARIQRQFTLAFSSFVAKSLLPIICSEIDSQAPDVSVLSLYWQEGHLENFPSCDIDLVLTVADEVPENLYGKQLGADQYVVMFRQGHPLSAQQLTLENYMQARHVQVNGVVGWENQLLSYNGLSRQSFKKVFATVPSFDSAVKVLIETDTVITAPLHIAALYAEKYQLEIREYPIKLAEHQYYILWHAKFNQDQEHKWFRTVCIDSIRQDLLERIEFGRHFLKHSSTSSESSFHHRHSIPV